MCGFAASFCQRRLIGAKAWPHYLLRVALGFATRPLCHSQFM